MLDDRLGRPRAVLEEGPARLDRAEVMASQRRRMLAAMVLAVDAKGYSRVSVADVVRGAGVSRATFYEQFKNKLDCYLACYDAGVELVRGELDLATFAGGSPRAVLRGWLERLFGHLAANPELLRVWYVDVYAAGRDAVRRRVDNLKEFEAQIRAMHQGFVDAGERVLPITAFDAHAIASAIAGMITNTVAVGEASTLRDLVDDVESFVLRCFGAEPR